MLDKAEVPRREVGFWDSFNRHEGLGLGFGEGGVFGRRRREGWWGGGGSVGEEGENMLTFGKRDLVTFIQWTPLGTAPVFRG